MRAVPSIFEHCAQSTSLRTVLNNNMMVPGPQRCRRSFAEGGDETQDETEPTDSWTNVHEVAFQDVVPAEWTDGRDWGEHAMDVNAAGPDTGLTPLHICCTRGTPSHVAFAAELLRRGADTAAQCRRGFVSFVAHCCRSRAHTVPTNVV